MSDQTNERKVQHIRIIEEDAQTDRRKAYFDRIHLCHRALPEIDLAEVDPSITFMGKTLRFPLLISSMTGGEQDLVHTVNKNLAIAAEATRIAMAVGSQRVMFTHPPAAVSFALREWAPSTLLFANMGAVQLNCGFTDAHCRQAVDQVGADALYLHLNPLQEAIQPEGDTNYGNLSERLTDVAGQLGVPVVMKEVGAGISPPDARLMIKAGIRYIDVAGTGGLSWSRIEHHRRTDDQADDLGLVFQDWGIPTPLALDLLAPLRHDLTLIASGGVRTGIDMVKAMILGASLCGLASPFLKPAMESPEKVIAVIEQLHRQFRTAMFLLGARTTAELIGHRELLVPETGL